MNAAKKWFSVLLCVLLVAVQAVGALAEVPSINGAVEQGREASFSASVGWNELPLVDESTNKLVGAILDSIEVTGRYANLDENSSYISSVIKVSGQDAVPFDVIATQDAVYIKSPIYGDKPVVFKYAEMEDFFTNLGTYMDNNVEQEGDVS